MNILFLINNVMAYTKSDFNHLASWENIPDIVMCEEARVSEKNIKKAISFWTNIGYDINSKIVKKYCGDQLHVKNEIRITGQRDLDTIRYYGMTDRLFYVKSNNTYLLSCNIKISDDSTENLELIIHELGHALGINHEDRDESHIMHHLAIEQATRYN